MILASASNNLLAFNLALKLGNYILYSFSCPYWVYASIPWLIYI